MNGISIEKRVKIGGNIEGFEGIKKWNALQKQGRIIKNDVRDIARTFSEVQGV